MKKLFTWIIFFFSLVLFSQNIPIKQFKKVDSTNIKSLLNYLFPKVNSGYKMVENNAYYYDNIFRANFSVGNYKTALSQIDAIRTLYMKGNPKFAYAIGIQYEVYAKAVEKTKARQNFRKIYEAELLKKYNTLSAGSQVSLPMFFDYNPKETKEDLYNFIKTDINGKSSIPIATALLLFRKYSNDIIAKVTYNYGRPLLKKLDEETYTINDSIIVHTKDKKEISISVIVNNKIKKPEATIIVNTIYSDPNNINTAKQLASNGYSCVYINTRGKYLSHEKTEPFEHEAEDIYEVIDWIVQQPWNNGKVGMFGGSYLGFSQWAATKKLHPALKTIVPQAPVGIGIDYPMSNNVFMGYMLRWIDYVTVNKLTDNTGFRNEDKWNDVYKKWYVSGSAFNKLDSINGKENEIFQRWLQHPSYDSYWQNMTPDPKEYAKINIPILTTTGYFDDDQLGAMFYYKNHLKYNPGADHYMIIGPYDHSGSQGYITSDVVGMKIDPAAEIDLNTICFEWFDYILKGKNKPDFLKGKINYEVIGSNVWKSANGMEAFDNTKVKYFLNEGLKLSTNKSDQLQFSPLSVDLKDRSDAYKYLTGNTDVVMAAIADKNNGLLFTTDVFEKPMELTGSFSGNLSFSINKKDCDLSLDLYEVLPSGKYFLLSSYLGRASYAKDKSNRQLLTPGKKEIIPVNNTPFISKKIGKGSRLLLKVGIKKNPNWQVNYGTGKDVSTETIKDAAIPMEIKWYNDSYVELPLIAQ
ncbi:CocE/NonD family hydrolase [Elizabethkingia meningoseptica]|uniref:CocE/NonD family hydrolase n=1 Tax=Elizabethkingia meningoseptica TaxID=238 RepID=UPI0023AF580C|nr:CocE/NonD family hydrolase [Elizabethkingia meningoseptica]MDE5436786.1 CocE/NonD family hydrolase [Elizabethkingia meningoseptica]MDE5509188.1 CocE/NonD family hydrolase [Elizabethkingia meningoseptica]MDE5514705.1 CocE/NonD family hydrolase [Elizabethkingia meningoseptica]MDE5525391.1 CocE/NonD family hydrolase [Elizabethkingia meningoseptica]MDE5528970.1 CocE/NonD family hydrolase [Elizabethkingia meningoseptica]